MNSKSTLALLVLASAAGVWFWKGDEWGPRIGLPSASPPAVESKSLTALTENFTPEKITSIEIVGDAVSSLKLEKSKEASASARLVRDELDAIIARMKRVADLAELVAKLRGLIKMTHDIQDDIKKGGGK